MLSLLLQRAAPQLQIPIHCCIVCAPRRPRHCCCWMTCGSSSSSSSSTSPGCCCHGTSFSRIDRPLLLGDACARCCSCHCQQIWRLLLLLLLQDFQQQQQQQQRLRETGLPSLRSRMSIGCCSRHLQMLRLCYSSSNSIAAAAAAAATAGPPVAAAPATKAETCEPKKTTASNPHPCLLLQQD